MGAEFDDTLHQKETLIHLMIGTCFCSFFLCPMSCKAPSTHSCSLICKESTRLDGHHVPPTSTSLATADSFDSTAGAPS